MFIFFGIILWILLGFIAFIWDAKITYRTEFDTQARNDLIVYILGGILTFIIVMVGYVIEKFTEFMNDLLKKINK